MVNAINPQLRTSTEARSIPWLQIVLLIAMCVPLFYIGLGVPPLLDPDEPVYAATGLAALHIGSAAGWWSPHYNGTLWFDKPPLTYWLISASEYVFGATPFAARLPSAICALIEVCLTFLLTWKLWPNKRNAAFWAGLAISSSLQTVILARAAVTDMILAALLTASLIGVWSWLNDEKKVIPLLTAGLFTGLATLTKGPVAIVLISGTILFYLLLVRQPKRLISPVLWTALLISLAVAMPWYLSMIHLHGSLFIQGFLEANNLTRYLKPEHPQTSSLLWFFPVLIGFIFPWTTPLICAVFRSCRAIKSGDRAALYALIWVAWVFGFFSLSETKLLTYIYPLYPAATALIGAWITSQPSKRQRLACGLTFIIVGILIAVILPGYVAHGNGLAGARPILDQVCVVFLVAIGLTAICLFVPAFQASDYENAVYFVPAAAIAVFFSLVALAPIWHVGVPDLSLNEMSAYIKENSSQGQPTIAFTLKRPSLVFYSDRQIIFTDDPNVAAAYLIGHPTAFCAAKTKYLETLTNKLPGHRYKIVLHSGPNYVLIRV